MGRGSRETAADGLPGSSYVLVPAGRLRSGQTNAQRAPELSEPVPEMTDTRSVEPLLQRIADALDRLAPVPAPKHDLDAAERSSGDGDTIRLNETLISQPRKRGELIVQVIRRQQPHHGFGACRDATILFGCRDLVTNIWARGRAQTVVSSVVA